jgi:hypothetical protein
MAVIGGLLALALLLAVFTWRFWLATRPHPAAAPSGGGTVPGHG